MPEERKRRLRTLSPDDITDEIFRRIDLDALLPADRLPRVRAVARANGLDPARLDEAPRLKAATWLACAACEWPDFCRATLPRDPLPQETEFCPNAELYRAFAALLGRDEAAGPADEEEDRVRRSAPASGDGCP